MPHLAWADDQLARLCRLVAGICLLGMLVIAVGDVALRFIYGLTGGALGGSITGNIELIRYLMMYSLLAGMAANVERSQVVVEAFSHRLSEPLKTRIAGLFLLGFVLVGCVLVTGLWEAGVRAGEQGRVTQDLRLSMGPIYQAGAVICAGLTLRSLVAAVRQGVFAETDHGQ